MTSVAYNATAASALSLLTGSNRALQAQQQQVSSGLKVNQASDNAAYWSIATTMGSHSLSLSSAEDATGLAAAVSDTAALGVEAATQIVGEIQARLVLAKSVGADKTAINAEISQLKDQLGAVSRSSTFNGENWLNLNAGETPRVDSMVASVSSGRYGVSVNVIDFDTASSTLVSEENADDGILTRAYSGTTSSGSSYEYFLIDANSVTPASATAKEISLDETTTPDEIDGMISATDAMLKDLTSAGAELGATSSRIAQNSEFLNDLQDISEIGVGRLIDADMEEMSARLSAQKAQQLLQIQGLNIANHNMGSLSALFR